MFKKHLNAEKRIDIQAPEKLFFQLFVAVAMTGVVID